MSEDSEFTGRFERVELPGGVRLHLAPTRKFKTVIALPPRNDVDLYAHDLGFVAITEGEQLLGYNL